LILFLFGVVWFGLYKPEIEKISNYRRQPLAARQQIETMVRQISSFNPPAPEERAGWTDIENSILRRIPKGRQITELYADLSDMAEKYGLQNFQRREIEGSDKTFEDGGVTRNGLELELTFDAGYSTLAKFLNGLQNMERLNDVVNLEVTRKPPLVGVRMVLRSYYLL